MSQNNPSTEKEFSLSGEGWLMNYFTPKQKWLGWKNGQRNTEGRFTIDGENSGAYKFDYPDNNWIEAKVPNDVRGILLDNKLIDDPSWGRNSHHSRWVEDYDWWFRKNFKVPENWEGKIVRLIFNGVDYEAVYWLNETKNTVL